MNNKQSSVTELYNKMMQYVPIEYHELVREEISLEKYEAMHRDENQHTYIEAMQFSLYHSDLINGITQHWSREPRTFNNYYNETFGGNDEQ